MPASLSRHTVLRVPPRGAHRRVTLGALLGGLAVASALPAQGVATAPPATAQPVALDVASIMRGPELYGRAPQSVRWHANGDWLYFRWLPAGSAWNATPSWYRLRADGTGAPEAVTDSAYEVVAPLTESGRRSRDGRTRLVTSGGDLWLVDLRAASARRLTETVDTETAAGFTADGRGVLFARDGNVFRLALADGAIRQLTDVRPGPAPRDSAAPAGQRGALARDQQDLLATLRDDAHAEAIRRAEREAREQRALARTYLPAGQRAVSLDVSPALTHAVVVTVAAPRNARTAQVPNYVTASGYTEELPTRTKVGDAQSSFRVWRLDLATGALRPITLFGTDSTTPAAQARVIGWNTEGTQALVSAVSEDFTTRTLLTVPASEAAPRPVDVLVDSAWVAGPCFNCAGWLPDGRAWFASEATGYAHLYAVNADGSARTALTSGAWEVLDAELSDDGRWFWLHTSETSPYVREFWRMPAGGGARERLTRDRGGHDVVVSPDGRRLADVYSSANAPPELFVQSLDGRQRVQRTTSTSDAFRARSWIRPAIVEIPASDGVRVPARIYRPSDLGATPNGAAVIFVHGAGYLHNVHEYWSSYAREYMFHHLLASKGYVVLDIDYRGSAGYGRDWRTAIYRHMGGRDLQDHVDGARWLQREFGIDPERVGIYGGSYGGFITLMALFTAPESFGAGAALRSVTDWAHYNHGYTARILNEPQSDTTAYRRSSPIFYADGLADPLLIAHGMVDTNVHFQDVVRLAQRLIELGKTDWEFAVYPVENHGFERPDSWTDEYRRILKLFDDTIGPNGRKASR